jgi:hypothetical protein
MPYIGGKKAKKKSSSTKRHFTVVMGSKEHGLYVSSSPSSAARKAVSKLCATDKKKKVQFSIREITQGSKKKTYGPYLGYIEKLKELIELKGRVIKYKPVAKLSGKTGVKKGGMRGGGEILVKSFTDNGNNITVELELNGKEYTRIFFRNSSDDMRNSKKYYFYNKTTKRYMFSLNDYLSNLCVSDVINQALREENEIVIRIYISGSIKELLGTNAELSNQELILNNKSIIPASVMLNKYPSIRNNS